MSAVGLPSPKSAANISHAPKTSTTIYSVHIPLNSAPKPSYAHGKTATQRSSIVENSIGIFLEHIRNTMRTCATMQIPVLGNPVQERFAQKNSSRITRQRIQERENTNVSSAIIRAQRRHNIIRMSVYIRRRSHTSVLGVDTRVETAVT